MYKKKLSGGFKRKRNKLVGEIIHKYPRENQNITFGHNENLRQLCNISDEPTHGSDTNVVHNANLAIDDVSANELPDTIGEVSNSANAEVDSVIEVNIGEHENRPTSREFAFNKVTFQSALASWAVNYGIKHEQLRPLLKIWNDHVPLPELPVDPRTLLQTPRNVIIKDNKYWYNGLKIAIQKMIGICSDIPDLLSLKINMDGISISKSSAMECWPILIEIAELPKIAPEIIGIYCGPGKPNDLDAYLREFVNELNDLLLNGLIQNGRKFIVKLECFVADSPARAMLKIRFYSYMKHSE